MQITARFYVSQITKSPSDYGTVTLQPAYKDGKNKEWAKYTPSGRIDLNVGVELPAFKEFERAMSEKLDIAITFEALDPE